MKEDHMDTTVADDQREERWEQQDREPLTLPARPRRRWLTGASAITLALATAAGGFYAGVRVEKSRTTSSAGPAGGAASRSAAAGGLRAALAARFGASGALAGSGSASGAGAATGGFGGSRIGGFPSAGGGNASFGTVSSVDGRTLYLTDASGNTVKVTLSRATKLSKSVSVSRHAVRPGDTVVVQGLKQQNGTLVATSVADSGARAAGGAGRGTGGGSAAGGGGLSSLFQSKGGG